MYDFRKFEMELFPKWQEQFRINSNIGGYSWKSHGKLSVYGSADMIFLNFILNKLQLSDLQKQLWADQINSFQKKNSGWYRKNYGKHHFKEHTTAYAVAALTLIDQKPRYSIPKLEKIMQSKKHTIEWLKKNNWSIIWLGSHAISGIPALILLTKTQHHPFFDWYFHWLDQTVNPTSGFWERGLLHKINLIRKTTKHEMAGAFHMFYIYDYFNRSWLYPKRIIDKTLKLQQFNGLWGKEVPYGVDMDAVYCLLKSHDQVPEYRSSDIDAAIHLYLKEAEKKINNSNFLFQNYQNSHKLVGAINTISLCQKYYPELIKTHNPWHFSLDYVPYI